MERASARDLVVGAEANRLLSTDSSMAAERAPCRKGISNRCRSEFASLDEQRRRQWLTLFHLRRSRPRSPSTKDAEQREESKYAAGA